MEDKPHKISEASYLSEVSGGLVVWVMSGYPLPSERQVAVSFTPYHEKEAQLLASLYGFGEQYVSHLSVLLWPSY